MIEVALARFDAVEDGPEWASMAGTVMPVRVGERPAVLKLMSVDFPQQVIALREYDGRGAAALIDVDAKLQALLLERLEPGTSALELMRTDDDAATLVVAQVAQALLRPAPVECGLPTYSDWAAAVTRTEPGEISSAHLGRAASLFRELATEHTHLLHGDLHHDNVLRDGDGWRAIDPAGVLGEPAAECGALLRNWLPDLLELPDPVATTHRRVAILAEALDLDAARIRAWAYAQSVMSVCWMIEDGHEWLRPEGLECIDLLHTVWAQAG
jgi:streptomycin 6-kinase